MSIPLTKSYGGIGAAMGTSFAVIFGHCIILNVYYHKKVGINMIEFWKNILKMSIPVIIAVILGIGINKILVSGSIIVLLVKIILYTILYAILMWKLGMNQYEKSLVLKPLEKIRTKVRGGFDDRNN